MNWDEDGTPWVPNTPAGIDEARRAGLMPVPRSDWERIRRSGMPAKDIERACYEAHERWAEEHCK